MRMPDFCWIAWWFGGILILAGLILRLWTGDHLFLARYTAYLMPWLLLILVPGVFWAVLVQYRWLAVLLGCSAMIIAATYIPLFWSCATAADNVSHGFKVISYNAWSKNNDIAGLTRVVKGQKPDILLLQEMKPETFDKLAERLQDLYPGEKLHYSYEPAKLLAIFSRYPMEPGIVKKGKGRVQKVVLHSPASPIVVFNVHMLRHGGWSSRYRKISRLLKQDLIPEERPLILGGDFNTPDQSETYRHITRFLDNTHWDAGFGFGFSYPAHSVKLFGLIPIPSLVRIDHIFINDHFLTLHAGTVKDSGGSDHFPVMAVLDLKQGHALH